MSTSSNFASTFAPYTPPPDDPVQRPPAPASASRTKAPPRPWFPTQPETSSYQSGGLPTLGTSYGGGGAGGVTMGGFGNQPEADGPTNQWESRFNMRVDVLAAFAYLLGPISALICLILETHNDYVRFHAYQSALSTTPLVLLRIFTSLVHFPSFLNTLITIILVVFILFMAFRAYVDAARNNLTRYYLPYVGLLADQWVSEE
ncbi:uncharacterized protein FOMMEDRAFT_19234 [Fomitiporia mediterranea MF3/22]|uniref:uncharacterized protein n=1 Tax=Fomitiporia mediterranea (strain MF3/22) TaxID=694068 RepID=UPI000440734E|nr:uncharacterized protein FOMMEDRAFT_19234 [Fomitiporia mediterranea MF3/22]EJD03907.1 hypothetical protein FOMMEDRAFT_19234 [Fomitiporia mediterranea MF3/22]